jgi:hypothetical protein
MRFDARTETEAARIMGDVIPSSALPYCQLVPATGFIRDNSRVVIR